MDIKDTQIAEGLRALERGWTLVSLRGKRPAQRGRGAWKRCELHDEVELRQAVAAGLNLGARCDLSGLVVIDADVYKAGVTLPADYPDTLTAESGRGGRHLYYRSPGVPLKGLDGPGIDVKDQGYVVLAPGFEGHPYRWVNDLAIVDLPASVVERLMVSSEPARAASGSTSGKEVAGARKRSRVDRSKRDFARARQLIESGGDFGQFVHELQRLPVWEDKGRMNPEYYERTWNNALAAEDASKNSPPLPVEDMSSISGLPWCEGRDRRQLRTDMAVAAWLAAKAKQLERDTFRVAVVEVARGVRRSRETVGESLHRLVNDGFIEVVNHHTYDVAKGSGLPRQLDVSPLLTGQPLRNRGRRSALDSLVRTWRPRPRPRRTVATLSGVSDERAVTG